MPLMMKPSKEKEVRSYEYGFNGSLTMVSYGPKNPQTMEYKGPWKEQSCYAA